MDLDCQACSIRIDLRDAERIALFGTRGNSQNRLGMWDESVSGADRLFRIWKQVMPNAATWTGSRKPNLFIIGSMKSGTTLLWKLLGSHPSIYMCSPKEPSYFVEPDQLGVLQPFLWKQGYWRSEERYLKLFQSDKNELFFGEASVYYTHLPHATGVAERLNRFNPQARLIYIMRDPIERTISHYWHRVVYNDEHRTMLQAVAEDSKYCDVSYYAM